MEELQLKRYADIPFNDKEILRYLHSGNTEALSNEIELLKQEASLGFKPAVCSRCFEITAFGDTVDFESAKICSKDLARLLKNCEKAVIFAATAGFGIDRMIMKYGKISQDSALICEAIGNERVESLCDLFCSEQAKIYKESGFCVTPRFSPGYGDLPLEFQTEIFRLISCEKTLGITLSKSLLMSPSKSVTAIFGIERKPV